MWPFIELIVRFLYFRLGLNNIIPDTKNDDSKITLEEVKSIFGKFGIGKGDSIMIHSSFSKINEEPEDFVKFLFDYIGSEGNILMPTHPKLEERNGVEIYAVNKSPSTVGFITEYFRKMDGVKRSRHPFSSVAVWGKDQDWFLEGNLNEKSPLPHGKSSPYYKLAQKGGIAVCIGVTAIGRGTIRHTAEEIMDKKIPLKDWFVEYDIQVSEGGQELGNYSVRKSDLNKTKLYIAKSKIEKEWLKNGILEKYSVEGIPIEFIDCKKCVEYMIEQIKSGNTSYPYAPKK